VSIDQMFIIIYYYLYFILFQHINQIRQNTFISHHSYIPTILQVIVDTQQNKLGVQFFQHNKLNYQVKQMSFLLTHITLFLLKHN